MAKIGLLAYPQCLPSGLYAALDFFNAANLFLGKKVFDVQIIGLEKASIDGAHKQRIIPELTVSAMNPEIIVVPGFWSSSSDEAFRYSNQKHEIQQYLNSLPAKKIIWSYCTGVLFHAKTGRLNGKSATASWWLAKNLEQSFPSTDWEINNVLSENKNDVTAAGANGFHPLFENALRQLDQGKTLAKVQKYLMTPVRLEKNDPFYLVEMVSSGSMELQKMRNLIEKTPAREISTTFVAGKIGITTKTLTRSLKKELNLTPAVFFRLIKYKQAGDLLVGSKLSISEICGKLGFDDESNFRRGFKNAVELTPGEYQKTFRRASQF